MKHGFKILIHKDIPDEHMKDAIRITNDFMYQAISENGYKVGRRSCQFYARGVLGYSVPQKDPKITFKRLVKNRRIFGVVPIDLLEAVDGKPLPLDDCMCTDHRGGVRVRLIDGFNEDDYRLYYEEGDIKG